MSPAELRDCLAACYPLHPLTALVLGPLFRQLAQNERSLFAFLASSEPFGFQDFLGLELLIVVAIVIIVIIIELVILVGIDDRQVALPRTMGVGLAALTFLFVGPVGTHGISPFGSKRGRRGATGSRSLVKES